jgi:hypothetical protein
VGSSFVLEILGCILAIESMIPLSRFGKRGPNSEIASSESQTLNFGAASDLAG